MSTSSSAGMGRRAFLRFAAATAALAAEGTEARVDKENEWPRIPIPRRGSPQHPKARHRQ